MKFNLAAAVLVGAIGFCPPLAQSQEDGVVRSFELLLNRMVAHGEGATSPPYKTSDGYRKRRWDNSKSPTYDIKRTDSLVSPYVAVLEVSGNSCVTKPAPNPEEVVESFDCEPPGLKGKKSANSFVQRYRFAYQRGKWQLTGAHAVVPFVNSLPDQWSGENFLEFSFTESTIRRLQE